MQKICLFWNEIERFLWFLGVRAVIKIEIRITPKETKSVSITAHAPKNHENWKPFYLRYPSKYLIRGKLYDPPPLSRLGGDIVPLKRQPFMSPSHSYVFSEVNLWRIEKFVFTVFISERHCIHINLLSAPH